MFAVRCQRGSAGKSFVFSQPDALKNLHGNRKRDKKILDEFFSKELKDGSLAFETIDISKPCNEKISDKYRIAFSSLLVINNVGSKEDIADFTKFAFATAASKPQVYRDRLIDVLKKAIETSKK